MNFKPEKSVDLTFSKSINALFLVDPSYDLKLNDEIIPRKQSHRHLGILLDEKLSFTPHVRELVQKTQELINPLKLVSRHLNSSHLEVLFKSFVLPHIDYCDIIYQSANTGALQHLEKLQYQAALLITGAYRGSNSVKVLNSLKWPKLSTRRNLHMTTFTFKVINLSLIHI